MKKQLLTAAIALTGLAAFSNANAVGYTPGDALLFFTAQTGVSNSGKNIQIDLGDLTSSSFSSFSLSSSALSAVLDATYGAGWASNDKVSWGLIGSPQVNAVDLTGFGLTLGTTGSNVGQPLDFYSVSTIGSAVDPMYGAGTGVTGVSQGTITDSLGHSHYYSIYDNTIQSSASANDANGFGFFSGTLSGAITGFSSNAIVAYTTADDGSGTPIIASKTTTGSFSVSGGQINVSAVPEPGTYALFGLGALLLVIASRRKSHNA
ncbi:MAG: PEP-CTERM sorting domain-containing protein [bacterium]